MKFYFLMWSLGSMYFIIRKSLVYHLHCPFFKIIFLYGPWAWPYRINRFFFVEKEEKRKSSYLLISTYMLLFFFIFLVKKKSCGTGFKNLKEIIISCFECNRKPSDSINESEFVVLSFFFLYTKTSFILLSNVYRLVIWITKYKKRNFNKQKHNFLEEFLLEMDSNWL